MEVSRRCNGVSFVFGGGSESRDRWSFDHGFAASPLVVHCFSVHEMLQSVGVISGGLCVRRRTLARVTARLWRLGLVARRQVFGRSFIGLSFGRCYAGSASLIWQIGSGGGGYTLDGAHTRAWVWTWAWIWIWARVFELSTGLKSSSTSRDTIA